MKVGVSGFVGGRLRAARQLRGLSTQSQLADLLGIDRQVVSSWENGAARPTLERFELLVSKLNMPRSFFLKELPQTSEAVPFYRSQKRATEAQRERSEALLMILSDIVQELELSVDLPSVNLPRDRFLTSFRLISDQHIEEIAMKVRHDLRFPKGPLPSLVRLLENRGVVIAREFLAEKELDGLSQWIDGRPYVLLNDTKSFARSRMDLAHELGHLILHPPLDAVFLRDKPTFDLLERQAFRFAGALLLPRLEFVPSLRTFRLDELLGLKVKYQVSLAAIIKRISDLELMPEEEVLRLWKLRSRGRWHTTEPLEDQIRAELPELARNAINLLRDEAGVPVADLLDRAGVPRAEAIRLLALDEQHLQFTNIVQFRPA